MQFLERLDALEDDAARLGLSLNRLCRKAGVQPSTIRRWRDGTSPNVATLDRVFGQLSGALAKEADRLSKAADAVGRGRAA